jgi:hypothetical protein
MFSKLPNEPGKIECLSLADLDNLILSLIVRLEPTRVDHFLYAPLLGNLLVLLANITLGWRDLARTNTLAYWVQCCKYGPIFTKLHFLRDLRMGPIS